MPSSYITTRKHLERGPVLNSLIKTKRYLNVYVILSCDPKFDPFCYSVYPTLSILGCLYACMHVPVYLYVCMSKFQMTSDSLLCINLLHEAVYSLYIASDSELSTGHFSWTRPDPAKR